MNAPHGLARTARSIGGLVLVRQRPGEGNAIFMTIEDETGIANTIIWPRKFEQYRPIVMGARVISVTGVLQNEKDVIHIVADRFDNLTPLLGRLSEHGDRIDTIMPPDVIKHPVYSRQRHPRSGDALVTMLKRDGPEIEDLAVAAPSTRPMSCPKAETSTESFTSPASAHRAAQSHMKFVPMVTLSTWQWWKPPSSRWNTFSVLLLRADRGETFLGDRQRDLLVARAVQQQERAFHLLHDAVEPEISRAPSSPRRGS